MGTCTCSSSKTDNNQFEINEINFFNSELKILKLSGLSEDEIEQKNILVAHFENQPVYIRTTICGDKSKPILILVHGWGGSGPLFFRIIKDLCKHFCFILPDVVGMGGSSRPTDYPYNTITPEETIEYFNNYFESWRVGMGNLKDFYLSGHSFGGYLVSNYAVKYPQYIKKLLLLSPIGIKQMPASGPESWERRFLEKEKPSRFILALGPYIFSYLKISPFWIGRRAPQSAVLAYLQDYVQRKQKTENEEQHQAVLEYMYQIFMRESITECALMVLFDCALQARLPLSDKERLGNPNFPIPFSIIYGDNDWVLRIDDNQSQSLIDNNKFAVHNKTQESKLEEWQTSRYIICPKSDHNMQMDNPKTFAKLIIEDLMPGTIENDLEYLKELEYQKQQQILCDQVMSITSSFIAQID